MRDVDSGTAQGAFIDARNGVLLPGHDVTRPVERLVALAASTPQSMLQTLARHHVPVGAAALIVEDRAPTIARDQTWCAALAADHERGVRMRRGLASVEAVLAPLRDAVAMCISPLGILWSRDIDALVRPDRLDEAKALLRAAGFLGVGPMIARLGHPDERCRYAVVAGTEVLTSVELSDHLCAGGPAAAAVIKRARTRADGALPEIAPVDQLRRQASKIAAERYASARGMLELAMLHGELKNTASRRAAAVAVRRVARLERRLGRTSGPATALAVGLPPRPNVAWVVARLRGARRRFAWLRTSRRVVVAFSGIDGSGKSTQAARLAEALERVGVPTLTVWGRIGYTGTPVLKAVMCAGRRVLPAGSHSAQRARAEGTGGDATLTRRGAIGWGWALAVTAEYLRVMTCQVRRARGRTVILDRALPDALIDLDKGFAGRLELRLHRSLIRLLAPRADITFYLRISGAAAHARKTDVFSAPVLGSYAELFDQLAPQLGAVVLDAERPADELTYEVLRIITEVTGQGSPVA